jgi:myo-inositol-1-phosphate synthase
MRQTNGNTMKKIRCCIVGIGNCASSIVQGLSYYKNIADNDKIIPGLMRPVLGGYKISDINIVAGFDIDLRKIGKDLSEAIFSEPNCTKKFCDVPHHNVIIMKSPVLDGVADHMQSYFHIDKSQNELSKDEIVSILRNLNADIIISYVPVGSQKLTEFWADVALDSSCAFVNCVPVFIASNKKWADKFDNANLPIIGDDVKSQCGATIINRALVQMIEDRGGIINNSWQLNVGGNSDFANMTDPSRLASKKISKTESISSLIPNKDAYIYAGPNGCINCLSDNKISFMKIDFSIFGDIPCSIDVKLSVEDSPNSGGTVIDCIRLAKIAKDRKIGGSLLGPGAYYMKHPMKPYNDDVARQMVEDFINDKI